MQILLDNQKITNYSINDHGINSFGYENINEIFFDVFEIKNKDFEIIKEKKGEFNDDPIIEMDLVLQNELYKNVRFVLQKKQGIIINTNLLDYTNAVNYEKVNKKPVIQESKEKKIVKKQKFNFDPPEKKLVSEKTQIVSEEQLLQKKKQNFLNSLKSDLVKDLKNEIRQGVIDDLLQEKLEDLFENSNSTFKKELVNLAEKLARRESARFYESGGGTNAVQYADGGEMNGDLTVHGQINSDSLSVNSINVDYVNVNNLNTNNQLIHNNLTVLESLCANRAFIHNNLTVNGNLSSKNNYVLGDVTITGNLKVSNEIFGDLVSGNTVVNSNGDTLLTKMVKNITGSNFVDKTYTINHNLNTFDILINVYYKNPDDNSYELVIPSIVNINSNTTIMNFSFKPADDETYKIILMS